ncbi:hypothetical protein JHK85_001588 [Glycine max]|nr:hypothetical protein JHK85_001588 [Glycine max]
MAHLSSLGKSKLWVVVGPDKPPSKSVGEPNRLAFDMFLLRSFSPPQPSHTLVQEIIGKATQFRLGLEKIRPRKAQLHLKQEAANMMKKIGLLEAAKRKFLGEGLGACSIEELQWIQQQLERSLSNVRARKEKVLLDENAKLTENGRLSEKVKLLLFGINSVWPIVHLDNILKQIEAVANYEGDSYMGKPVRINCQKAILMMKCSALFSRPLSTSPNQLDGDKITGATNHKSVNLEGSLLVQHLFKDHRRCSYMIANALDKDGSADNYSLNGEVAVTCLKNAISYFSDHTDYLKNVAAMIFPLLLVLPQAEWETSVTAGDASLDEFKPEVLDWDCSAFFNELLYVKLRHLNVKHDDDKWVNKIRDLFVFFASSKLKHTFLEHLHYLAAQCKISPPRLLSKFFTDEGVTAAVQVESLQCYAFLCSLSQDKWQIELLAEFPSVLVPFASDNQSIRVAAMSCIDSLRTLWCHVEHSGKKNGTLLSE